MKTPTDPTPRPFLSGLGRCIFERRERRSAVPPASGFFLPAARRHSEWEARLMGQLIGGWTVLAAGVWWLGGVSFFSWQLPLRLLSFPLVWFFLMQIFTLLASAPAALACSLGGMRPIAAARLVEAGIILEFTAVAIWMLRTPGFAAPCVGGFWMLLLGAEILCRFITPPTATR